MKSGLADLGRLCTKERTNERTNGKPLFCDSLYLLTQSYVSFVSSYSICTFTVERGLGMWVGYIIQKYLRMRKIHFWLI